MASIKVITADPINDIFPVFGTERKNNLPIWNEDSKMFITSQYTSQAGNQYYKGIRFCDRLAIVETFGIFHTWTYLNDIDIYTFDGKKPILVAHKEFEKTYRNNDLAKKEAEQMLKDFIKGQMKLQDQKLSADEIENMAQGLIEKSYMSFLDKDYSVNMNNMLPIINNGLN